VLTLPVLDGTDPSNQGTVVKAVSANARVLGGQVADHDGNTRAVMWRCRR